MAPSYTRLIISGITGEGTWKEQVGFWDNVYGADRISGGADPQDSICHRCPVSTSTRG